MIDDSRRVEGLLRDLSGEHRLEIGLIVGALREGIPAELIAAREGPAPELRVSTLARRLQAGAMGPCARPDKVVTNCGPPQQMIRDASMRH